MTSRLPFTQLAVRRAIAAAQKEGLRVVAIKSDGTVVVDDKEHKTQDHPLERSPEKVWRGVTK